MDYHLDHRTRLSQEGEYKNLYSWSLQEVATNGEQIGLDQVPWRWSLNFYASELRYTKEVKIKRESAPEDIPRTSEGVSSAESIYAVLHSGKPSANGTFVHEATYSMFGTNRQIENFSLVIQPLEGVESKDACVVWGGISYTSEVDFRTETEDDILQIYVTVSSERFNELRDLVNHVRPDVFLIRLGRVAGFYSEWSPSVTTNRIKVLTDETEHKVEVPEGCEVTPPRLGGVGEFSLTMMSRNSLELGRDSDESSKVDELTDRNEKGFPEPAQRRDALVERLAGNQIVLVKLKWPIWLIVVLLLLLLLK